MKEINLIGILLLKIVKIKIGNRILLKIKIFLLSVRRKEMLLFIFLRKKNSLGVYNDIDIEKCTQYYC